MAGATASMAPAGPSSHPARRTSRAVSSAALLIAGSRLVTCLFIGRSVTYFWDEWPLARLAASEPLQQFSLGQDNGYWAPLSRLLAWFLVRAFPFQEPPALALALLLTSTLFLLVWRALRAFSLSARARLTLFAWFCWSPLVTMVSVWWSVAIGLIPASIACLLAFRTIDSQNFHQRDAWRAGGLVVVGLLFSPITIAAAFFVAGWALLYRCIPKSGLSGIVVPVAIWLAVYLSHAQRGVPFEPLANAASVFSESWAGVYMLGLVGGPWTWASGVMPWFADTPSPLVFLITSTLLLALSLLFAYRQAARRPLVVLTLTATVNAAALLWTATGALGPELLRQGRYWLVMLVPTVLTAATVTRDGRPWPRKARRLVVGIVSAAVVGSVVSSIALAAQMDRESGRPWLDNARAALAAHPGVNIQDTLAPASLISNLYWPDLGLTSGLLAPSLSGQTFNRASEDPPLLFDLDGSLRQGALDATQSQNLGCVPISPTPATLPPMQFEAPPWIASLDLAIDKPGQLELSNGEARWTIQAPVGRSTWYLPSADPSNRLEVTGNARGCITASRSGRLAAP